MGESVSLNTRFSKSDDFVTRKVGGDTLIVPIKGGISDLEAIYTLNEVGSLIWTLIDGERTAEQIVYAICADYEVNRETATADVLTLITELETEGIIRQKD